MSFGLGMDNTALCLVFQSLFATASTAVINLFYICCVVLTELLSLMHAFRRNRTSNVR
ncbi:hypothetical protein BDV30DRAFT_80779 [Aspergillus minisclerotigenes]|uniref:Uncharacterized protein n=1 Tax=Aspergillus minisclerotigenes TaxID=656917 RepID=A0A5N6J8F2_9EURO|nr:hypothetical protein BDV30DRAFT_80779 [Aspergillus minisclerotigenes]